MGRQSDRLPGWNRQRLQLSFKEGRSGCATVQRNRKEAYESDRNFKKFRGILRGFQKRIGWAFPFPTSVTRPPTSTWEYWGLKTIKNMTWIFKDFLSPPPVSFWSWLTYAQPERPSLNHEQTAISTMLEGRSLWVQNMGTQSDRPSTAE